MTGTKALVDRLESRRDQVLAVIAELEQDYAARQASDFSSGDCPNIQEQIDDQESLQSLLIEAIAALSAQPAPVAVKTEREWQLLLNSKAVWIDSRYAYFIPLSDAEEMVTGKPATAAPPASPPPQSGPEPIPRPIDFFNPLTLDEAKARNVCRICQVNDKAYPGNPFVLHFGTEYAHRKCIDAFSPQSGDECRAAKGGEGMVCVPRTPVFTSEMKSAHIGEYNIKRTVDCPGPDSDGCDGDDCSFCEGDGVIEINEIVPWDTCKQIFKGMYESMLQSALSTTHGGER